MRMFFVLVIFALLFGCSANQDSVMQDRLNITFSDMNQTERFDASTNNSISMISFVLKNDERFPVNCTVDIDIDNSGNMTSKEGNIGIIEAGNRKKVSFDFIISEGNTSFSIKQHCVRY
jgi:hypothetical protein